MTSHLLIFDRAEGAVVRQQSFSDPGEALRARFAAEREFEDRADVEVVVLNAGSEAALRRTHRRYFESVSDMLRQAG